MKSFRLKRKDLEVLYYISNQNFATTSELYNLFWKSKKTTISHYRRLSQLKKKGFIDSLKALQSFEVGYTITLKGQDLLIAYGYKVSPCVVKKDSYTGTYEHDLLVNTIKNILLKSPLVENFIPEYQLAYKLLKNSKIKKKGQLRDKIPDGLFTLFVEEKPQLVALELELSLKSKKRYENIFSKHLLTKKWDAIFYVVKDEIMRDKLLDYVEEIKRKSFLLRTSKTLNEVYFSLVEEVLNKELEATFIDRKIDFKINDLEKNSMKKEKLK